MIPWFNCAQARLCLQLGYSHPDQLIKCLTARQLNEWLAYDQIEPFGEIRQEIRHGQQMALMCNLKRDSKIKPQPYTPREFMHFVDLPEERPPDPKVLSTQLAAMFDTLGKSNGR